MKRDWAIRRAEQDYALNRVIDYNEVWCQATARLLRLERTRTRRRIRAYFKRAVEPYTDNPPISVDGLLAALEGSGRR